MKTTHDLLENMLDHNKRDLTMLQKGTLHWVKLWLKYRHTDSSIALWMKFIAKNSLDDAFFVEKIHFTSSFPTFSCCRW